MSNTFSLKLGASVLPVYDKVDGHARMYYAPGGTELGLLSDPKITPPRVLSLGNAGILPDYGIQVSCSQVTWPEGIDPSNLPVGVTLRGYFQPHGSAAPESAPCTNDSPFQVSSSSTGEFQCEVKLNPARQYLPWGLRGKICWSLNLSGSSDNPTTIRFGESPLEVYFVASNASNYEFLYRGLPIGLFRKFLLPLRLMEADPDIGQFNDPTIDRTIGDNAPGWLVYVAEKLHFQKNMKYNSFGSGQNMYFDGGSKPLHLEHWVDDCTEKETHVLNCYDLAGFMNAIIPLGLQSTNSVLRMKYQSPFGYINTTRLIGRGTCNSPLPHRRADPFELTDQNDSRRTGFGSHVYMTIAESEEAQEMALDSTCRPLSGGPHGGRESLQDYLSASIDHTTTLYKTKESPQEFKLEPGEPKTWSNPKNWPGVANLFTEAEIFHSDMLNSSTSSADNVLANVATIFPDWSITAPNVMVNPNNITATWCMMQDDECLCLRISRCALDAQAKELYAEAKENLHPPHAQSVTLTEESDSDAHKSFKKAWDNKGIGREYRAVSTSDKGAVIWTQGTFFVQIMKDDQEDLPAYVSKLVDLIGNLPKAPEPSPLVVENQAEGTVSRKFTVGQTFEIQVSNLPRDTMIPLDVFIEKSKVLYLSSSKSGETVTFKFLARAETGEKKDTIEFCTFNASMKHNWADAKVSVAITSG